MKHVQPLRIALIAFLTTVAVRGVLAQPLDIHAADTLKIKDAILQDVQKQGLDKQVDVLAALKLVQEGVLIRAWEQQTLKANPVTPTQREAAYQELLDQLGGNEYRVHHITLADAENAQILTQRLQAGLAWDKVELKSSANSEVKITAQKSDWINQATAPPAFREAIKLLKPGQVYPTPIKTTAGWHVLGLAETRVLEPPALEQVKAAVDKIAERKIVKDRFMSLIPR